MRRWCVIVFIGSMTVGCQVSGPLFGPTKTRIPPPATGSLGRPDAYYRGSKELPPGDRPMVQGRQAIQRDQANLSPSLSPTGLEGANDRRELGSRDLIQNDRLVWRRPGESERIGNRRTEQDRFVSDIPPRDFVDLSRPPIGDVHQSRQPIAQVPERDLLGPPDDFIEITQLPGGYSGVARRSPRIRGFRYGSDGSVR